jgi:hypothetical protein
LVISYIKANEKNKNIVTMNASLKSSYGKAKEYIKANKNRNEEVRKVKYSSAVKNNIPPKETFRYEIYLENGGKMEGDHITIQDGVIIINSKNSLSLNSYNKCITSVGGWH